MSRIRPVLIFLLSAAAAPVMAAPPAKFDLICAGDSSPDGPQSKTIALHLSIDQGAKRWCYRDVGCPTVFPIVSIAAGKLTLLAVKTPYNEASFQIDLGSGDYVRANTSPAHPDAASSDSGHCQRGAFTPLP